MNLSLKPLQDSVNFENLLKCDLWTKFCIVLKFDQDVVWSFVVQKVPNQNGLGDRIVGKIDKYFCALSLTKEDMFYSGELRTFSR